MSRVVSSKQPKLGPMQELSFSRISESITGYTFTPCVGSFTSPGIRHQIEGTTGFLVSSERQRKMLGEQNCLSFETAVGGIELSPRLTVQHSRACPLLPTLTYRHIGDRNYKKWSGFAVALKWSGLSCHA